MFALKNGRCKTPAAPMLTISVEAPEELAESVQRRLEKLFGPGSVQPMAIQTVHTKYDQKTSRFRNNFLIWVYTSLKAHKKFSS